MMGTAHYDSISRTNENGGEAAVWRRIREALAAQAFPRLYFRDPSGKRILLPETKEIGIDGILDVSPVEVPQEAFDSFQLPQDRPQPAGGKK